MTQFLECAVTPATSHLLGAVCADHEDQDNAQGMAEWPTPAHSGCPERKKQTSLLSQPLHSFGVFAFVQWLSLV